MALRPALVNNSIPVSVKVLMLKALIIPVAVQGGELFGMNKAYAKFSQPLINMGLQWILRGGRAGQGNFGRAAVGLELKVAPLHTLLTRARVRAWVKCRTFRTWIATLISEPFCGEI